MDQTEIHEAALRVLNRHADKWVVNDVEDAWREDRVYWELRDNTTVAALQIRASEYGTRPETPLLVFLDEDDFETGDSIYDL